jgi:hypothetical protein
MRHSESINEIAAALAKAQGGMKSAVKDSLNPHFKSKYADMSSVKDAIGDTLVKVGIAVIQAHDILENGTLVLRTRLIHTSGQWLESTYPVRPVKDDPQGLSAATTYARRVTLSSILSIVSDVDDDGETASGRGTQNQQQEDTGLAAAKAFVRRSVKEIGALTSATALAEWKAKMDGHLARLLDKYPDEGAAVMSALVAQAQAFKAAAE